MTDYWVSATATKTLEVTLAPFTVQKERRLQRTVATYRRVRFGDKG